MHQNLKIGDRVVIVYRSRGIIATAISLEPLVVKTIGRDGGKENVQYLDTLPSGTHRVTIVRPRQP